MRDDWLGDMDWNGGEWWQQWPPPPGSGDDYYDDNVDEREPFDGGDITQQPDYTDFGENLPGQYDENLLNALDYLTPIAEVDANNIRGLAFENIHEAIEWLKQLGLLGISKVVESNGLYYPVIGEYDDEDAEDGGGDDQDWNFEGFTY